MQPIVTAPPKSQQVADSIRHEITSGNLKPGERLQTVRQFAQRYQVSNQVVQSAFGILNKAGLIESHVGRGTFVAEVRAESRTVAMILDGTGDPHARLPLLLPAELQRRGLLSCVLDTTTTADGHSLEELRSLLQSHPRALIVDAYSLFNPHVLAWRSPRTHLVVVKRHEMELPADNIFYALIDFEQAGYLAARHLLDLGRTRIVLANFERRPGWTSDLLARGWERALSERGVAPLLSFSDDPAAPHNLAAMAAGPLPDGFLCHADFVYRDVLRAARHLGREPGRDFDAVGFGNTPWAKAFGIASVDPREDKLAVAVADHLEQDGGPGRFVAEPELHVHSQH